MTNFHYKIIKTGVRVQPLINPYSVEKNKQTFAALRPLYPSARQEGAVLTCTLLECTVYTVLYTSCVYTSCVYTSHASLRVCGTQLGGDLIQHLRRVGKFHIFDIASKYIS